MNDTPRRPADPIDAKQAVIQDVANFLATKGGFSVAALLLTTIRMAELGGLPRLTISVSKGEVKIDIFTQMGADSVTGQDLPAALHRLYQKMEELAKFDRTHRN